MLVQGDLGLPADYIYSPNKSSLNDTTLEECKALEKKYVDLYYPNQKELRSHDFFHNPSMHFYFCLGNSQAVLRRYRNKFVVSARGFVPAGMSYEEGGFSTFFNVFSSQDLDSAVVRFRSLVLEILEYQYIDSEIPF